MPLTDDEQSDLRRHLEYSIIGLPQSGNQGQNLAYGDAGFRFLNVQGVLEYRQNQFSPVEESKVCGKPYGSLTFTGMNPLPGASVTVTIVSDLLPEGQLAKTVVVPAQFIQNRQNQNWSVQTIAAAVAQAFAIDTNFQQSGLYVIAPYGAIPWAEGKIPSPTVCFYGPAGSNAFKLLVTWTGNTAPQLSVSPGAVAPFMPVAAGSICDPCCGSTVGGEPTSGFGAGGDGLLHGYIPICNYLEAQWLGASSRLVASIANSVTLNARELEMREQMYHQWCCKLAKFIGLPLNPDVRTRDNNFGEAFC